MQWFAYAVALLLVAIVVDIAGRPVEWLRPAHVVLDALAITALPRGCLDRRLRYRLYDIDLIINNTAVYVLLTAASGVSTRQRSRSSSGSSSQRRDRGRTWRS